MSTGSCECGRRWTGHAEAHCATCHAHFSSDKAFDKHLASPQSDDACYPPESITRKDGSPYFILIDRVHGATWMVRRDDENPFSASPSFSDSTNGGSGEPELETGVSA